MKHLTRKQTIDLMRVLANPGARAGGSDANRLKGLHELYPALVGACRKYGIPQPEWLPHMITKSITATDHRGVTLALICRGEINEVIRKSQMSLFNPAMDNHSTIHLAPPMTVLDLKL